MSLLEFSHIHVRLGSAEVLKDISLRLTAGEFVGLLGPNGAGKSTLLRTSLHLVPYDGSVMIDGHRSSTLKPAERARLIAYIAQEREVAWPLSVEALVALGRSPHRGPFSALTAADFAAIEGALERMDIKRLRKRVVGSLSGGERARVLIARALAQETPILIADEPTAALDPAHQLALMEIFQDLAREGRIVLASMHDLALAARGCTRIILMHGGQVVADGTPRAALTRKNLATVYGIGAEISDTESGLSIVPDQRSGKRLNLFREGRRNLPKHQLCYCNAWNSVSRINS